MQHLCFHLWLSSRFFNDYPKIYHHFSVLFPIFLSTLTASKVQIHKAIKCVFFSEGRSLFTLRKKNSSYMSVKDTFYLPFKKTNCWQIVSRACILAGWLLYLLTCLIFIIIERVFIFRYTHFIRLDGHSSMYGHRYSCLVNPYSHPHNHFQSSIWCGTPRFLYSNLVHSMYTHIRI